MKSLVFLFLFITPFKLYAEWSSQGFVGYEGRLFEDDGDEGTEDRGLAFTSQLEWRYSGESLATVSRIKGRIDEFDQERNIFIVEDLYFEWLINQGAIKWRNGFKTFNWTATEAFHPVDVINSRNFDGDFENLEKLGELVSELEIEIPSGTLTFFVLPRVEDPVYPSSSSRLGYSEGTFLDPVYKDSDTTNLEDEWVLQGGLRWSGYYNGGDFSFHLLRHMDRSQPLIAPRTFSVLGQLVPDATRLTPHYFWVNQVGATLQHAFEGALEGNLFKLESAYRQFDDYDPILTIYGMRSPESHGQIAFGWEYLQSWSGGTETTFILEGQTILEADDTLREELGVFQRDGLFGFRHAFNDVNGKELFVSTIVDLEDFEEMLFNISYSQRLGSAWKVKSTVRYIEATVDSSRVPKGLQSQNGDNQISLSLLRYF